MENEKQKEQKEQKIDDAGLAQLAAEQRFNEFETKFRKVVDEYVRQDKELNALRNEFRKYNKLIDAMEKNR